MIQIIKISFYFCVLLLINIKLNAQNTLPLRYYTYPNAIPSNYIIDPIQQYNKLMEKELPKKFTKNEYKRYCELVSFQKANIFNGGQLYYNWKELESYLNDVLKIVLPEKYKKDNNIHAYPVRWTDFNAYAIHDGTFYINIGLIADAKNEAALACILGHELVHFQKQHVRSGMLRSLKANTKNKRNSNYELLLDNAHSNRVNEQYADSLGAVYAANAGYDLNQGVGNFAYFLQLKNIEEQKKNNSNLDDDFDEDEDNSPKEVDDVNADTKDVSDEDDTEDGDEVVSEDKSNDDNIFESHPDLKRRVKYYKGFAKQFNADKPKKYIVSRKLFKQLQNQARLEVLSILFENNDYKTCVQKAMAYHLMEPQNPSYIYYLTEAMRRSIFLDAELKSKPFLCEEFSSKKNKKIKKGILANINLLIPDEGIQNSLSPDYLVVNNDTDEVAFKTWIQAYRYFVNVIDSNKIEEGYLTIALGTTNAERRKIYLDKYIESNNVLYKPYAKAMKNGTLYSSLDDYTKELTITSNVKIVEDYRSGYRINYLKANEVAPEVNKEISDFMAKKFKNKELSNFDDIVKEHLQTAMKYRQAILTSILFDLSKTSKLEKDKTIKTEKTKNSDDENAEDAPTQSEFASTNQSLVLQDSVDEMPYFNAAMSGKKSANINTSSSNPIFNFSPEVWMLFKKEQLKSLELLKIQSFTDKTNITGLHINPLWYILVPFDGFILSAEFLINLYSGSAKHSYKISYFNFTPKLKTKSNFYYEKTTHFKFNKDNMKISVFDAFKTKPNIEAAEKSNKEENK